MRERGVSNQTETRIGGNGCISTLCFSSSWQVSVLFGDKNQQEKRERDPEHMMLALTSLRDFLVERGIGEFSMPVYDPNRAN